MTLIIYIIYTIYITIKTSNDETAASPQLSTQPVPDSQWPRRMLYILRKVEEDSFCEGSTNPYSRRGAGSQNRAGLWSSTTHPYPRWRFLGYPWVCPNYLLSLLLEKGLHSFLFTMLLTTWGFPSSRHQGSLVCLVPTSMQCECTFLHVLTQVTGIPHKPHKSQLRMGFIATNLLEENGVVIVPQWEC